MSLLSCSSAYSEKKEQSWNAWKGHSDQELSSHPYYKNLPINEQANKDGTITKMFRDMDQSKSQAYCKDLGGCPSVPMNYCDNIFTIKDHKILAFEQVGQCTGPQTLFAPRG
jgi:hypothetical protein